MELRDYLNVILVRRWTIIQAIVVVALTALVASMVQPRTFQGEAKVLISESDSSAALFGQILPELSSQPERALQTQVQLMQLRPLAENTVRRLGLEMTPQDLLEDVEVSAVGQTNVVWVRAQSEDPDRAALIANTLADEYVKWSRETKRESLSAAAEEVEQRLKQAKSEVLELGRKIQAQGKSDDLAAELAIATGSYTTLAEKLEQLRINEQLEVGSGRLVSPAVEDLKPIAPQPFRNTLLGAVVGLVFGFGMAFLYEYLDNTIKSSEEAERLYGAPVLGIVPLEKYEKGVKRRLTIVESPGSAAAEAYRVLRNSLDFINFERDLKTVLITSAAPGEGKSTVAANLAASLAQAGKKVVLVSCDFRRPTTDQFYGVNNMIGLSDVLLGTHSMKAALQRPGDDQLLVMTAGKMPPNPSELLGSTKMKEIIESLEEWADWVIVDSPPLLAVADPVSVARWVDGVLMVSRAGESTKEAATKGVELLSKVGARVIGVAVWGLDETRNRPGYGYGYGYGYYTGGYYYYSSYYGYGPAAGKKAKKQTKEGQPLPEPDTWVPQVSPARRIAVFIGKLLSGLLAFLVVLAVAAVVVYFLDGYFGWGLYPMLRSTVGGLLRSLLP